MEIIKFITSYKFLVTGYILQSQHKTLYNYPTVI